MFEKKYTGNRSPVNGRMYVMKHASKIQGQTLLKKFKRKLMLEGAAKAFLAGLAAAAVALFVLSLVFHFIGNPPPVAAMVFLACAVLVGVFLALFFILYFPSEEKAAARVDELGLEERVSTMLDYKSLVW